MENQQNAKDASKGSTKKTLIICGGIVAVAVIAVICMFAFGGNNEKSDGDIMEFTFEQFCMGMKDDLPKETMDEVKELYEQAKQAFDKQDMDKLDEVYTQLEKLDVYDADMNAGGDFIEADSGNASAY